jgi:threonine dehydrogenase-like Zn-dependent dehydrogenase
MKALYIKKGRLSFRKDYPEPKLKADEALVKVNLAGICSTDLELVKGYANFEGIPGHEFVGEVVKVKNSKDKKLIGRRVVSNINLGCGECEYCNVGIKEHCLNGKALGIIKKDGIFAEYVSLPVANIYTLTESVTDRQAVFVEPLAAALRISEVVKIPLKGKVAVLGPGRLGILISQVLSLTGVRLTLLGRIKESLNLPKKLGLGVGLIQDFKDKTFDLIVDATGSEGGLTNALRLIKPLGTIVVKSTYQGEVKLNFSKLVVDEITIIGSRCGPFLPAIELLAAGKIRTEELIEAEYPLKEGIKAFEHAARPGVKKILLKFL